MVNRTREHDALLAAAQRVRQGTTMVVTIVGEPGIGKSRVVRTLIEALPDFAVVEEPDAAFHTLDAPPPTPTLVVFDDAQRLAPEAVERAASTIAAHLTAPLLVVVAGLPADVGLIARLRPESCRDERGRDILLGRFSTQETVELAAEHRIADLDVARAELLAELTDGNPHHLATVFEQLGQQLHGSIPRVLPVPASFVRSIELRLGVLDDEARAVIDVLAVAGQPLAIAALAEVASHAEVPISLDRALASGLVEHLNDEGQRELRLPSARVRAAVRARVAPGVARRLHAGIAATTTGWARLEHLLEATEYTDERLAREVEAEGVTEAAAGRYPTAARMFSRASGVSATAAERERRLLRAGALAFYADDAELAGLLSESVSRCAPGLERTMVLAGFGYLLGDFPETLASVQEHGLDLRGDDASDSTPEQRAFIASVVASVQLAVVDLHATIATSAVALDALPSTDTMSPGEARLRLSAGFALWIAGGREQAVAVLEPLVTLPLNRPERADALVIIGQQQFYNGEDLASLRTFDSAIESAQASEALHILPLGLAMRAQVQYSLGQWDAAALDANAVLTHTTASRNGNHDGIAQAVLAMIAAQSGQLDDARRAARVARRLGVERPLPQHRVGAAVATAVVERASGNPHAVIQALGPLLEGALDVATASTGYTGWRAMHAEALIALGSLRDAERVIERLEAARSTWAFGYPEWLRGLLAEGRGDSTAAVASFRAAVATGDEAVTPFAHALAQRSLANALIGGGRVAEADPAARAADRLFAQLGAASPPPAAAGDRAMLDTLAGWVTLTPRERDTALLAAEGMLNREIALSMHVSVKTVEKHVANTLAKLGLRSRRDLERAAGRGGSAGV